MQLRAKASKTFYLVYPGPDDSQSQVGSVPAAAIETAADCRGWIATRYRARYWSTATELPKNAGLLSLIQAQRFWTPEPKRS